MSQLQDSSGNAIVCRSCWSRDINAACNCSCRLSFPPTCKHAQRERPPYVFKTSRIRRFDKREPLIRQRLCLGT